MPSTNGTPDDVHCFPKDMRCVCTWLHDIISLIGAFTIVLGARARRQWYTVDALAIVEAQVREAKRVVMVVHLVRLCFATGTLFSHWRLRVSTVALVDPRLRIQR